VVSYVSFSAILSLCEKNEVIYNTFVFKPLPLFWMGFLMDAKLMGGGVKPTP